MTDVAALKAKWKAVAMDPLRVHDVTAVNHVPHPFMVGPKHIEHAAEHHAGLLGDETCRAVGCYDKGPDGRRCTLAYEDHVSDTVMVLQLMRDVSTPEIQEALKPHCKAAEADGIDGFVFLANDYEMKEET